MVSCGCQFGWQRSPDCEYAYPVFCTGPGRRAYYAWLLDLTAIQNVPRHHILDRCRILEMANQPWRNNLWVVHGRLRKEVFN